MADTQQRPLHTTLVKPTATITIIQTLSSPISLRYISSPLEWAVFETAQHRDQSQVGPMHILDETNRYRNIVTLRTKLSGAVYCYRSCLCVCMFAMGGRRVFVGLLTR